jgi:hypothetical protein
MFKRFHLPITLPFLALASACSGPASSPVEVTDDLAPSALGDLSSALHAAPPEAGSPLAIRVLQAPQPVATTDEERLLVYELLLDNRGPSAVRIERIDTLLSGGRQPPVTLEGEALLAALVSADGAAGIGPGETAVVFLEVRLPLHARTPPELRQRVAFTMGETHDAGVETEAPEVRETFAQVDVDVERALRVGSPLSGPRLVAVNGCCDSGHRHAIMPIGGELFLAQRFAIDFLRIDGESTFSGDPADNASYFIHGADVLAVRSGEIVAVRDGVAENDPTEPVPPFDVDQAPGNFIVQRLDGGGFALYAHLQPGSSSVSPGQRVLAGASLALVGNTGNSTEPHLHFHVMDRPDPLAARGLPYVFDNFEWQGRIDVASGSVIDTPEPRERSRRLPLNWDVIDFGE